MSDVLAEFGYRVREARTRKGWKLEYVAELALMNPDRKGYVSQIENGKIRISPRTVGNLARVLDLPESVTAPMLRQHLPQEDEVANVDHNAERLLRTTKADASVAPASEALLISLAYEFARGSHTDLMAAFNGLKAALSDAADLKARGLLPQNTSDQVQTLMQRVADLNDRGLREEAAVAVDTALADLDARHAAEKSAFLDIGIRQDRIRNNPASAATRLLAQLRSVAHPGGLFNAIDTAWEEWHDRGYDKGIGFDLHVSLHLARANLDRAQKGQQRGQALLDLGNTLLRLGEWEGQNRWLTEAIRTFRVMLSESPRKREPMNWAIAQSSLGTALQTLGEREGNTDRLKQAVQAYRDALLERTRDRVPLDWATTQNNLGNALQTLGEREGSPERLKQAVQAFRDALLEYTRDRLPMKWATTQNNLGTALRALGELEGGVDRFKQAVQAYSDALLERTRDRVPLDWAAAWGNMGEALTLLADRTNDLAMARQALVQLQEAEAVLREGEHQPFASYSADRIPRAQAVIDRLSLAP